MASSPLILHIDTAGSSSLVALSAGDTVLAADTREAQAEQAAWLQPAIGLLMAQTGVSLKEIDAVSVSAGPGSYTGLRIGMASAKGICFALEKPLIVLSTLKIMALAMRKQTGEDALLCPQIDARRLEVFTALYNSQLHELLPPQPLVLTENSYDRWLAAHPVVFAGSGAAKCKGLLKSGNAFFIPLPSTLQAAVYLGLESFARQGFADLASAEPLYVKAFYTPAKANS